MSHATSWPTRRLGPTRDTWGEIFIQQQLHYARPCSLVRPTVPIPAHKSVQRTPQARRALPYPLSHLPMPPQAPLPPRPQASLLRGRVVYWDSLSSTASFTSTGIRAGRPGVRAMRALISA